MGTQAEGAGPLSFRDGDPRLREQEWCHVTLDLPHFAARSAGHGSAGGFDRRPDRPDNFLTGSDHRRRAEEEADGKTRAALPPLRLRPKMRIRCAATGALWALGAILFATAPAAAQERDDFGIDRIIRDLEPETPEVDADQAPVFGALDEQGKSPFKWTFAASSGAQFTSNAAYADSNTVEDIHFDPAALVNLAYTRKKFTLGLRASVGTDQHVEHEDNNASFVAFRARADLGPYSGFTPFVSYAPRRQYTGFFADYDRTLHDVTIGTSVKLGRSTATLSAMRREATIATSEHYRASLGLSFGGPLGKTGALKDEWAWALEPTLQRRMFTGGTNDGRDDLYIAAELSVKWSPPKIKHATVRFVVNLEHNSSDMPGRDYLVLNIGPKVAFQW